MSLAGKGVSRMAGRVVRMATASPRSLGRSLSSSWGLATACPSGSDLKRVNERAAREQDRPALGDQHLLLQLDAVRPAGLADVALDRDDHVLGEGAVVAPSREVLGVGDAGVLVD